MIAVDFSTEVISGAIGGGTVLSLLAISLKRTWSDRDTGAKIYIEARKDAKAEANEEVGRLRVDMEKRLADAERKNADHFRRLHSDIDALNAAILEMLGMISPERVEDAMKIVVGLPGRRSVPIPVTRLDDEPTKEEDT